MQYRHEWKHEINRSDLITLRQRLRAVAKKAIERKPGARSLKGIIEDTMLDIMFDIPQDATITSSFNRERSSFLTFSAIISFIIFNNLTLQIY